MRSIQTKGPESRGPWWGKIGDGTGASGRLVYATVHTGGYATANHPGATSLGSGVTLDRACAAGDGQTVSEGPYLAQYSWLVTLESRKLAGSILTNRSGARSSFAHARPGVSPKDCKAGAR